MVHTRTTGPDRDAALRRIAIVLSSLPAPIASQLLGSVDPDSKRLLRQTMTSLSDVDPLERQRALQAFKGSFQHPPVQAQRQPSPTQRQPSQNQRQPGPTQRQPHPSPQGQSSPRSSINVQDEISIGLRDQGPRPGTSRVVSSSVSDEPYVQDLTSTSLTFLEDVDDETLTGLLCGEHPQAIALVLASIAPAQAARILPCLDADLQRDALSRIGRLGEIPNDVVNEIASHLRARIQQQEKSGKSENGKRALDAILAALPQPLAGQSSESPIPPHMQSVDRPVGQPTQSGFASPVQPSQFTSSDLSAVDQTHRLRLATTTWPDDDEPMEAMGDRQLESVSNSPTTDADTAEPATGQQVAIFASTDAIHQHLIGMTPKELCLALGKVSTRQAMLALCGLPNEIAESVLAVLPRSHAKQVRRGINSLQSLQLREIDRAKEAVAAASIDHLPSTDTNGGTVDAGPSVRMAA